MITTIHTKKRQMHAVVIHTKEKEKKVLSLTKMGMSIIHPSIKYIYIYILKKMSVNPSVLVKSLSHA